MLFSFLGVCTDPSNLGSSQKLENSSILVLDYTIIKNFRILFCLIPFKSHWKEVVKTPLTLVKAIILVHLMALQSSGIFKILTKSLNCVKFENSQTLDSHPLYQNYLFDRSKGCFENLFTMALEWYQAKKSYSSF